jgi:hypothetical protein
MMRSSEGNYSRDYSNGRRGNARPPTVSIDLMTARAILAGCALAPYRLRRAVAPSIILRADLSVQVA